MHGSLLYNKKAPGYVRCFANCSYNLIVTVFHVSTSISALFILRAILYYVVCYIVFTILLLRIDIYNPDFPWTSVFFFSFLGHYLVQAILRRTFFFFYPFQR